ncbi:hypothetical protein E2C01_069143 [Portunus trituberculatus]|uniref:Uncharacterized protein n=1 Tax=Portunus trituberculatus TaxID=210409 RepID=A0A5B7I1D9_PORTR|nr:hypothetical protein [Portunus trituberculatus]
MEKKKRSDKIILLAAIIGQGDIPPPIPFSPPSLPLLTTPLPSLPLTSIPTLPLLENNDPIKVNRSFSPADSPQATGGNTTLLVRHTTVVQWNHACFGVRGVSKRTGSNSVHVLSEGWASSLGATAS